MATKTELNKCIIVPGLYDSGDDHWQTWIERQLPRSARIAIEDWSIPNLEGWVDAISALVHETPPSQQVYLVAHSFGCLAGYAAARRLGERISGALFVAPSDPLNVALPDSMFASRLPFRSIVVASEDDAWMSLRRARGFAEVWRSEFVNAGCAGHINVASGFGPWPEGLCLLQSLTADKDLPRDVLLGAPFTTSLCLEGAAAEF